tara:strand:+ start:1199 stop:1876 length:678 start_codon:yes stop_codon:yes gene_type:complete
MKVIVKLWMILILTTQVQGFASLYGPTGILKIPTAEVMNTKEYNLSSDLALNTNKNNQSLYMNALNIGIIKNTEFGILSNSELSDGVYLNAKWNLKPYSERLPFKTAIGLKNFPSNSKADFYLVGTKRIQKDTTLHFGNSNKFANKVHSSVFLGVFYTYTEDVFFASDISSESDNTYNFSLGVYSKIFKERFNNNLYFKGTILNLIKNSTEDSYISLGINYTNFM